MAGATWHFAMKAHREAFKQSPESYAPQYGGYCAYGVARGLHLKLIHTHSKLHEGKLYLNLSKVVLKRWRRHSIYVVPIKIGLNSKAGTYVENKPFERQVKSTSRRLNSWSIFCTS